MVRGFNKLDEFQLPRGRCIVVACPFDINEYNFHWLLDAVVFIEGEYLVIKDIRLAFVKLDSENRPYLDPDGIPVLGFLVRKAGKLESVAYTVFET
jgi:hypothetical protein